MHPMYLALHEVKWHGAWSYGVHRTYQDGSSFTWHQPCNNQTMLNAHFSGYSKCTIKSYSHSYRFTWGKHTMGLLESGEQRYTKAVIIILFLMWCKYGSLVSSIKEAVRATQERGAGITQWLEHRTRDWKVAGSNPYWNGGRIFFSRVDFLCWLLFRYPFHPRVTTVARKKSRSFCQKCRWQVTAKTRIHLTYMWILLNRASALVTTCP